MEKYNHRTAVCPSCNQDRNVDQQKGLREVEKGWRETMVSQYPNPDSPFHPYEDGMRRLALRNLANWFWACDQCLKSGRALRADISHHNIGLGTSFAAYVDRPFQCQDCNKTSLFSPAEQKYWFETLQFLIWVYPKQCTACRKKRRKGVAVQKALQDALKTLDASNTKQLEKVAELYEEMGIEAKAAVYRNRAKNRSVED